jgi:hypothetical protein
MVQGGHHGGSVAAPIAAHILEQALSMDQGNLKVEVAALAPARKKNPFEGIETLADYKGGAVTINPEEDSADTHELSDTKVDMKSGNARPDIRVSADARGKVAQKVQKPSAPQVDTRNFFQRMFGAKPAPPRALPVAPPRSR